MLILVLSPLYIQHEQIQLSLISQSTLHYLSLEEQVPQQTKRVLHILTGVSSAHYRSIAGRLLSPAWTAIPGEGIPALIFLCSAIIRELIFLDG